MSTSLCFSVATRGQVKKTTNTIFTCTLEIIQYALNQRSPAEGKGKGQKSLAQGIAPVSMNANLSP